MIKAIAIDDEPLALKIISNFCEQSSDIQLEKTFTSQTEALKYIKKFPVDLLFLDIQMPKKDGISFYKNIDQNLPVIFTTAFQEYAVEGFNLNAVDYLVKPFTFERFEEAVKKAVLRRPLFQQDFLMIRADYKLHKINHDEILFIEALDDYIKIHLKNDSAITARQSLKNIQEILPSSQFIRVHRSFLISLKEIGQIGGKSVKIRGFVIPVGNKYKDEILKFIL